MGDHKIEIECIVAVLFIEMADLENDLKTSLKW